MFESLPFFEHKTKTEHTNVYSVLVARRKGFCLGTSVPIASLCSLPRQRKHSTGMFSSANHRFAPSLFESLPFHHKTKIEYTDVYSIFVARRKGFCLGTSVPIASLRSLPRLKNSPPDYFFTACSNPLFQKE